MAATEGRVAKPERWWGCRRGTPVSYKLQVAAEHCVSHVHPLHDGYLQQNIDRHYLSHFSRSSVKAHISTKTVQLLLCENVIY